MSRGLWVGTRTVHRPRVTCSESLSVHICRPLLYCAYGSWAPGRYSEPGTKSLGPRPRGHSHTQSFHGLEARAGASALWPSRRSVGAGLSGAGSDRCGRVPACARTLTEPGPEECPSRRGRFCSAPPLGGSPVGGRAGIAGPGPPSGAGGLGRLGGGRRQRSPARDSTGTSGSQFGRAVESGPAPGAWCGGRRVPGPLGYSSPSPPCGALRALVVPLLASVLIVSGLRRL